MYCRKCGNKVPDNSRFCDECGTAVNANLSSSAPVATPAARPSVYQSEADIARAGAEVARAGAEVARAKVDLANAAAYAVGSDISPKSRLAATLLAVFLGAFGAHRFYLGKYGSAAGMLILTIIYFIVAGVTGTGIMFQPNLAMMNLWALGFALIPLMIVGIWAFVDFIVVVSGHMRDGKGRRVKKWR
ncbi:MAG: TM2 domain-containing protein [Dehalococcoidales bacterium]|nr:TM2 domain-containing protein [Dehalococcoidales bacterium]